MKKITILFTVFLATIMTSCGNLAEDNIYSNAPTETTSPVPTETVSPVPTAVSEPIAENIYTLEEEVESFTVEADIGRGWGMCRFTLYVLPGVDRAESSYAPAFVEVYRLKEEKIISIIGLETCHDAEGALAIKDINFDGFNDIVVETSVQGAHPQVYSVCFLWRNPYADSYSASYSNEEIVLPVNARIDRKNNVIRGGHADQFGSDNEVWRFQDGEFICTDKEISYFKNYATEDLRFGQIEQTLINGEWKTLTEFEDNFSEYEDTRFLDKCKNRDLWDFDIYGSYIEWLFRS